MLNILDVFSGAGGLTEGFRNKSYFKFICHIEMDKDACASLELRNIYYYLKNGNNLSPYFEYIQGEISRETLCSMIPSDITQDILNEEISKDNILSIFDFIDERLGDEVLDGIIGGPPCQTYSTVGRVKNKQKKSTDKRIYLYKHYLDFLQRYNPRFFVFENVKGLLSFKDIDGEPLFPQIMVDFNKCGYSVEYQVINANEYGICQKRERLILVGVRNDLCIKKLFFSQLSLYKEKAPVLKDLLQDLPTIQAGEGADKYQGENTNEIVKKYIRKDGEYILTQHSARPHNRNDLEIYKVVLNAKLKGKTLKYIDLPQKLRTHSNLTSFLDRFKALDYNSPSHTVVAHISKDGHYYIHPDLKQNRSITVREAARIQGFPDNFYFEHSRTAAFKQIGNAVPPVLSFKIASAILEFLKKDNTG